MSEAREAGTVVGGALGVAAPLVPRTRPAVDRRAARPVRRGSKLRRGLVLLDVLAVTAGWTATVVASSAGTGVARRDLASLAVAVVVTVGALAQQHLYRARVASIRADEVVRIGRAGLASVGAALAAASALGGQIEVATVVFAYGAVVGSVVFVRGQFGGWLRRQRATGHHLQQVVVLGDGDEAAELVTLLQECPEVGFRPVGVVGGSAGEPPARLAVPWLGAQTEVLQVVERTGATGVLIASGALDSTVLNRVVRTLHQRGVHVHLSSGLVNLHRRRLRVQPIAHEPLIYVEPRSLSRGQLTVKRAFDLVVASIVLVLVAPLLAVAALAIRLSDGGPVFFRQSRVGRDGQPFRIWKLRTMVVDAEQRVAELAARNERHGPLFKLTDDPRITRIGRLLRDTSIDELPQLFNVLRGDMSMVGPRPALPEEVEQFDEELLDRLRVKPGVSGLWQVEARDKASFRLYRRLDLFYVENWSLGLDLSVVLGTVPAVLRRGIGALATRFRPEPVWSPAITTEEPS